MYVIIEMVKGIGGFDKPAMIYANGEKQYWVNGVLHKRVINKPYELKKCLVRFCSEVVSILKS